MRKKITMEMVWNKAKKNFVFGKDYIETETEEYIVFCPFNYSVLSMFQEMLKDDGRHEFNFHMAHCVCNSLGAYVYWFEKLYQDGRLKTFFVKKNLDLNKDYNSQPKTAEFTGWIDFSDRNFLHFAHLVDNDLATGEYYNWEAERAYNRHVSTKYKKQVDKMNMIVAEVYDTLFGLYDKYIDSLENTLHGLMDEYA